MKLSRELQQAYESAQALIVEREKILNLINASESRIAALTLEQNAAFERLSEEEADGALLEGPLTRPGKPNPALRTIGALRDEVSGLQARVAGLYKKYAASEEQLDQAHTALVNAHSAFAMQVKESFTAEYRQAAETMMRVARRGTAIFAGLGQRYNGIEKIHLPDPLDGQNPIVRLGKYELINGRHVEVSDWDAESLSIVNTLQPIQQLAASLSKDIDRLRSQRHAAAQAALTADAPNRPKSSAIGIPPSYYEAVEAERAREQSMFPRVEHAATHQYPNNPEKRTIEFGHMNKPADDEPTNGNQTNTFTGV